MEILLFLGGVCKPEQLFRTADLIGRFRRAVSLRDRFQCACQSVLYGIGTDVACDAYDNGNDQAKQLLCSEA